MPEEMGLASMGTLNGLPLSVAITLGKYGKISVFLLYPLYLAGYYVGRFIPGDSLVLALATVLRVYVYATRLLVNPLQWVLDSIGGVDTLFIGYTIWCWSCLQGVLKNISVLFQAPLAHMAFVISIILIM